jgi:hypothetical protein
MKILTNYNGIKTIYDVEAHPKIKDQIRVNAVTIEGKMIVAGDIVKIRTLEGKNVEVALARINSFHWKLSASQKELKGSCKMHVTWLTPVGEKQAKLYKQNGEDYFDEQHHSIFTIVEKIEGCIIIDN